VTRGARLAATGVASVGGDTVSLLGEGFPPGVNLLFVQGTDAEFGGQGSPFGDGLRCIAGSFVRLDTRVASASGARAFGGAVPGDPSIAAQGVVPATGATRRYQVFYRNAQPFCTAETFNLTNGVEIVWSP
jgi:hypothetical protein